MEEAFCCNIRNIIIICYKKLADVLLSHRLYKFETFYLLSAEYSLVLNNCYTCSTYVEKRKQVCDSKLQSNAFTFLSSKIDQSYLCYPGIELQKVSYWKLE